MAEDSDFQGFPRHTAAFFKELKSNNDAEWFAAHKPDYDAHVLAPAKAFVTAMGRALRALSPDIMFLPAVNKSIFRIYRDTRFSGDKTPYKTHLGIYFWEGSGAKLDCPGFYFHLEPPGLMLGAGVYMFSKPLLAAYREAVADEQMGSELARIAAGLRKKGYEIGMPHYKKIPRGYDPDHPRADLLKFSGLTALIQFKNTPAQLHTAQCVDLCFKHFQAMAPIQQWLVDMVRSQ